MAYFLAKTEPGTYSIGDLERDGETVWDGVKNAAALLAIRAMQPGDIVLIYHSGGESAIVGTAEVISKPRPDTNVPKSWVADVRYRGRVAPPVTLRQVKESGKFADFALVRQSRLSTMAVPQAFIDWLRSEHGAAIP
ncbi:MAG TPA: EVE domain-containing protein [Thermomicrobiales bacterium]|jgi:predicted RNA-binding protein with PUA-like domain|nr:EVE domain-containing protein [Thermomicrobiales bacterium]